MIEEELKAEAKKLGYVLTKKPIYQCSCYMSYPNEYHKRKNRNMEMRDRVDRGKGGKTKKEKKKDRRKEKLHEH